MHEMPTRIRCFVASERVADAVRCAVYCIATDENCIALPVLVVSGLAYSAGQTKGTVCKKDVTYLAGTVELA